MKVTGIIFLALLLQGTGSDEKAGRWTWNDFRDLEQMAGTWYLRHKDGSYTIERWEKLQDSLLEGSSYHIAGADTVLLETIRLSFNNGNLYYRPTVKGQNDGKEVSFPLAERRGMVFIFEHKEHDFPQQISYDLTDDDHMKASISGNTSNGFRRIDFAYTKQSY